jgi:hypothetical protein
MRVRRVRVTALAIVVGASLIPTSMSLASVFRTSFSTLNLSAPDLTRSGLAVATASGPAIDPNVWAVPAPSPDVFRAAASPENDSATVAPDGTRALGVTVTVGTQRPEQILTNAATATDVLLAMGLAVGPLDVVQPSPAAFLFPGAAVRLIVVRQLVKTVTESVGFTTLIQYSSKMLDGAVKILSPGHEGSAIRTYLVTYQDGSEAGRVLLTEDVITPPIAQLELRGIRPVVGIEQGQASWYTCPNPGLFAANLSLPFGTQVTVTNLDNGKSVTVVINDRGPYGVAGRIIDLCSTAFEEIAPLGQGVANVEISW